MPTEKKLNIAKGKVMMHQRPVGIDTVKTALARALSEDSFEAVDNLFSELRMVYTIFEYMQQPGFHARFSDVHQRMFEQLYYSERAWGQDGLQDWWDSWSDDHNRFAEAKAKAWLTAELDRVADAYIKTLKSGRHLQTFDTVMQQIEEWREDMNSRLFIPKPASVRYRNPDNGEGPSNS